MTARKHELNLDPDFDPLDPSQVSDPNCWIAGDAAEVLKRGLVERISMIRHAPTIPKSEMDIADQVEIDKATGKYRLKEIG